MYVWKKPQVIIKSEKGQLPQEKLGVSKSTQKPAGKSVLGGFGVESFTKEDGELGVTPAGEPA